MLLGLLRFFRGYVRFSVSGKYPERFLNITSRAGIRLWEVQRRGEGFCACMYRSDYRRIRTFARKAGVRLSHSGKGGLPEFVSRYRDRVGVVIGACVFIITVFVMSLFIWSMDITGLDRISYSEMKEELRGQGLYIGAFKPSLDDQRISRNILLENHDVGWMAINIQGSYASVEIKEEAPAPEVADIYSPCNIKAKRDGVILRMETLQGATEIEEGSGVVEGQLLVSGVMGDEQGTSRLVRADARIFARTTHEAAFSVEENQSVLVPNGEVAQRKSLMLFGLSLPYCFGRVDSPYAAVESDSDALSPLGITLPVGVTTERVSALTYRDTVLDDNSAIELLEKQSQLYELFCLSDCTVEDRAYTLTRGAGAYTLHVTYTCVEDIAVQEPIGTDENTDLTRYVRPTQAKE